MTNQEQAKKIAADVLANNPREYNDGRRKWARQKVADEALAILCGDKNEHGQPTDVFDENDPKAIARAEDAIEAGNEWIGESWANRQ